MQPENKNMNGKTELNLEKFQCIQCHACCREPGYVRLLPEEPDAIAKFLGMDIHAFIDKFTRLTRDRHCLSLIEAPDEACIFLSDEGCAIEPVKPIQCKNFPHKWKFSDFEHICGWAKKVSGQNQPPGQPGSMDHIPRMPRPSSSSK